MDFKIETDEETLKLLEISAYFLEEYFSYEQSDAISMIEQYYDDWKDTHDDDYYHHLRSYHVAVRVHYFIGLGGSENDFLGWQHSNNLVKTPYEALDYFKKHYFTNQ